MHAGSPADNHSLFPGETGARISYIHPPDFVRILVLSVFPPPLETGSGSVVDFRKKPVRNYLQRREQLRLLSLVLALGLVVILMNEVRKPRNWAWFMMLCGEENTSPAESVADPGPLEPTEVAAADSSLPVPKDPTLDGIFELTPEQLETIQDDTVWLREEKEAWFRLLKILRQNDEPVIEDKSEGRVTYTQLCAQSKEYRGQLVTVEGIVRRANRLPAPKNTDGFGWRFWLFPTDNVNSPIVVYCLDLPEGFPIGMKVEADVEVTGFFFKRWAYNAWDPRREKLSLTTAPAMLAKNVRWHPVLLLPEEKTITINARFFMTIIGVAAIVSFLIAVYIYYKTRRGRAEQPEPPVNLDVLLGAETSLKNGTPAESQASEG